MFIVFYMIISVVLWIQLSILVISLDLFFIVGGCGLGMSRGEKEW